MEPPFDILPFLACKIEVDDGCGVKIAQKWPAQPWYACFRAVTWRMEDLGPADWPGRLWDGHKGAKEKWSIVVTVMSSKQSGLKE